MACRPRVMSPPGFWKITGGSRVWPTRSAGSHENPAEMGYRFECMPGSRPRPPGMQMGCRNAMTATDKSGLARRALRLIHGNVHENFPALHLGCGVGADAVRAAGLFPGALDVWR
jgi:hypothetical protein